jgi:hypothetical protein
MRRVPLLALVLLCAACAEQELPGETQLAALHAVDRPETAQANSDVAALRAATAHLQRFSQAAEAGYATQFPEGCFSDEAGAMGFHYLNGDLVGSLEPTRPQLVMYEPQRNGTMKLVGVEFIAPGTPADTPPVLFGQNFRWNPTFEVWVLHAWVWQNNPAGMFADWNPTVSCEFADNVSATSHH